MTGGGISRIEVAKWPLMLVSVIIITMALFLMLFRDLMPPTLSVLWRPMDPAVACIMYADAFQVWNDYQICVEERSKDLFTFQEQVKQAWEETPRLFPWMNAPGSAVLVEFRPLQKPICRSIQNALDNLPVSWCIQIAGSAAVLDVVRAAFPFETFVQKIRLVNLGKDAMSQDTVSEVFVDRAFFNQLQGDHWLTLQIDSAICSQQRHLLKQFIQKDYGWWGAPWRFAGEEPYFGGNGGFSLRQKRFIVDILDRFIMNPVTNEDGWYIHRASDFLDNGLSRPPAPFYEAMQFSVETVMHTKPFAVHQPWNHLRPDYEMMALMSNCPELLSVMPGFFLEHWPNTVCAAAIDRSRFIPGENIEFDWAVCETEELREAVANMSKQLA